MSRRMTFLVWLCLLSLFPLLPSAALAQTAPVLELVDAAGQPAAFYLESSRVRVRVTSPYGPSGGVPVDVQSTLTGDLETVWAEPTAPGVYEGTIRMRTGGSPEPGDGYLDTAQDPGPPHSFDTVTATYTDAGGTDTDSVGLIGSLTTFVDAYGRDAAAYAAGATVYIQIEDQNRNTHGVFDQVYVQLASPSTGDDEVLQILEVEKDSGIFAGWIALEDSPSASPGDGRLQAQVGETIAAQHTDVMGYVASGDQAQIAGASLDFIEADGNPAAEVLEKGTARVRLFSLFDNQNQALAESVTIEMRSLLSGDIEPVTLTETGPDTAVFEGSIVLSNAAPGSNGQLETRNSGSPDYTPDTARASYGPVVATATVSGARIVFLDAFGRETTSYAAGETVRVRVTDHNRNDPQQVDTIQVEVVAPQSSNSFVVTMTETGFDTGVFEGSKATAFAGGNPNALGVVPGDTVEAWHYQYNSPNRLMKSATIRGNALWFVDAAGQPVAAYLESSRAYLRLFSAVANSNPTVQDGVFVLVISELTGDDEQVNLTETGPNTSVFTGSIALRMGYAPQPNNGILENTKNQGPPIEPDTLHASYADPYGTATAQAGLIGSRTWFADAAGNPVSVYPVAGTAYVRVEDQNRNTQGVFDTVHVHVVSPATGDDEVVVLLEVSKSSGIFAAALPLVTSGSPSPGDNRLNVMPGALITAEHIDVMGFTSSTAEALIDFASLEFIEADGEPTTELLENGTARVRLFSAPANFNSNVAESVTVELRSVLAGDVEPVTLTETGPDTAVFEGSIGLAYTPAGPDGQLSTRNSGSPEYRPETVRAIYSYFNSVTATATVSGARIVFLDGFGRETASYAAGETVRVRVIDHNRNNPQSQDTFTVELTSPETGSNRVVQVTETGFDTGVFEGSQATAVGTGTPTALGVIPGGTVEAWHYQYNSPTRLMKAASIRGNALLFVDAAGQPAEVYLESSRAYLRLFSAGANSNPSVQDGVFVLVISELTGDDEQVNLTETGPNTSVFTGSIALRMGYAPQPNNGYLENTRNQGPPIEQDTLFASYGNPDGVATARASLIGSRTWFADTAGNPVSTYPVGGTAYVRVEDQNRNTPGVFDQIYVRVVSPGTGDDEQLVLLEVSKDSGIFAGPLPLVTSGSPSPGDNRLHVMPGLIITAEHIDVLGFTSSTDQALIDYASLEFIEADGEPTTELLENGTARVRLFSSQDNHSSSIAESVMVEMRSLLAGDVEPVTLTETGSDTGTFEGSIELAYTLAGPDGLLATRNSSYPEYRPETVQAIYGFGGVTATATVSGARIVFLDAYGRETAGYAAGETVRVRVIDHNRNNPQSQDTLDVELTSPQTGNSRVVQLTETGFDTGVFEGSQATVLGTSTPSALGVVPGGTVEAWHYQYNSPTRLMKAASIRGNALLFVDAAGQPAEVYLESSRAYLRLFSARANGNPTAPDSVQVMVTAELTGDTEYVTLTETGPGTSVFEGSIALRLGYSPQSSNGYLENDKLQGPPLEVDTLHASYGDPDGTATAQASLIGSRTWFADAAGNEVSVYPVGGTAWLRVEDQNRNTPGVIDQVHVHVTSQGTGDDELLQLQEVAPDAGVFAGSLPLTASGSPSPGDNQLHVAPGYLINAEHIDVMGFTSSTDQALIDYASLEFVEADGQTTHELLENGTARVRLFSVLDNNNPGVAESVSVELRSFYTGDVEPLLLTETGPGTGIFEGSIDLAFGGPGPDGQLNTFTGGPPGYSPDTVRASYGLSITATATTVGSRVSFLNLRGQVTTTYSLGSTVRVRIQDHHRNYPAQVDTVYVQVQALGNGDPEVLELTETGADTGVFERSLPSVPASTGPNDGTLSAFAGEQVEVTHYNYNTPNPNKVRATFGSSLAPQLVDDTAQTIQDQPVAVPVLANDASASPLLVASVTQGAHGTVAINLDGTVTYTPAAAYTGPDTFTYLAVDAEGGEGQATVTVTVIPSNQPPQANYDQATTPEDLAVVINVLANDNDPDNDLLQVVSVTQPASGGAVAINGDNTVTFTPAPNFFGDGITFTYVIRDPDGATASSAVTVNVTPVNDAPAANDDTASTTEDQVVVIPVQANDTDIDSATFYPVSATQPANGSVVVSSAEGTATYTPNANFHGTDTFVYTLQDDAGATDTATVTVTVSPVNDPPVANDDTASTDEDSPVTISVLANDTDADNDTLNVTAVTQGTNGTVVINPDKTVTYTPNANFSGTDSFTYTAADGNGGTDTATVAVTVSAVNDAPAANDDADSVAEDGSVTIPVLANDTDPENDTLDVTAVTQGTNGAVVINPDKTVTYTPNANFSGTDTFTYTASDGNGTDTATVTVTVSPVNDVPAANDDADSVAEDESVTIPVLANDTDPENDTLDVTAVTQGTNGAVVINPDKTVTYTPNASFHGTDTFTYTASDGNGTDTATVTVTVTSVNDAPAASADSVSVAEDGSVSIPVLANDTDADNDTLTVSAVTQGTHGSVSINPDNTVTYVPQANFSGSDTFTYTASDGNGGTATANVTVTITAVNDAPVANSDSGSVAEDSSVTIPVLANDTDADNDTLNVTAVTQGTSGTVVLNPDKTVTYTPAANFNGSDSFTYTISDGNGGTATASVNVTVIPANDAPAANADASTTPEDTAVTVSVLANDTDPDGHTLSVASVTQGVSGSVVINPNGTVTYTPSANFSGNDAFTYTASDGNGGTATASVSITVTPVNDAPVAVNDSMNTMAEVAVTISVLANDFDLDGPSLSIASATQGANGTVTVNGNLTVTYTPNLGFKGNDSFTYTITDGAGGTATATVTVTVMAPPRISTNLQVLYDFAEGSGSVVNDVSGVGTPLNLTVSNPAAVSWLPGALSVNSATLLQTAGNATKVITACQSSNAITIEAWVMPDSVTQTGPAHIVALSQNTNKRDFALGQSASRYEAILRISNNQSGTSVLFGTGTATVELTHVVFTRDSAGNARTYINGTLSTSSMLPGSFSQWASFKLGVANDLSGSRPWVGDLHLVAVYSQALSSNQVRQNYLAGPN